MDLKLRLQRMLQIVEEAERVGALADIERDILLGELREAYAELKFGVTEKGTDDAEREQRVLAHYAEPQGGKACVAGLKQTTENDDFPIAPATPIAPITPTEEPEVESEEPEVEVELIFDEEAEGDSEEIEDRSKEIEENLSTLNSQLSTPKRSALLSLYEENPAPVLGEQFRDAPSVADTISCPKGVAESTPVVSLREAIGVADKFMLIRELFGGDADAYEKTLDILEMQPSLDDCIIYIAENYTWSPNSAATKFLMELLQRKYN